MYIIVILSFYSLVMMERSYPHRLSANVLLQLPRNVNSHPATPESTPRVSQIAVPMLHGHAVGLLRYTAKVPYTH